VHLVRRAAERVFRQNYPASEVNRINDGSQNAYIGFGSRDDDGLGALAVSRSARLMPWKGEKNGLSSRAAGGAKSGNGNTRSNIAGSRRVISRQCSKKSRQAPGSLQAALVNEPCGDSSLRLCFYDLRNAGNYTGHPRCMPRRFFGKESLHVDAEVDCGGKL
jgi:hypothetical protein